MFKYGENFLLESFPIRNYLDLIFISLQYNICMGKYLTWNSLGPWVCMCTLLLWVIKPTVFSSFLPQAYSDFPLSFYDHEQYFWDSLYIYKKSPLMFLYYISLGIFLLNISIKTMQIFFKLHGLFSASLLILCVGRQLLPTKRDLYESSQMQNFGCAKCCTFLFSPHFN